MLLRPSPKLNLLIVGVLARGAARYDMGVCHFVFLSNHYHLLLRPTSALQLARFMNYLNSNVAREAGRLYRWREKFWGRRYRPVPVSFEPEAQVARLRYVLSQGCKELLVGRPQQWPGASSTKALLGNATVTGIWRNRTAEYWAERRGEAIEAGQFESPVTLALQPLPCWDGLSSNDIRQQITEIVAEIVAETKQELRRTNRRPLGVRRILRQDPHSRPSQVARSSAPRFHAASWPIRKMLEAMYLAYRDAYRDAARRLAGQCLPVRFPSHGIPPPAVRRLVAS